MNPQRISLGGPPPHADAHQPSVGVHDVLFTLFRHKKLLLVCAILSILAGAVAYFFYPYFYPTVYQSRAKLFVRYLVERSAVDGIDNTGPTQRNTQTGSANIASEVEILSSWDLAEQVAGAIGPKRLLPDAKDTPTASQAAGVVSSGLRVEVVGNILSVSYENPDPELARQVLEELVARYFVKHLEVHRSAGAFDFVTQQTDQVRARLNQTEDALKPLNEQAGIISLADGKVSLSAELSKSFQELRDAEVDLVVQQARIKALSGKVPKSTEQQQPSATDATSPNAAPAEAEASSATIGPGADGALQQPTPDTRPTPSTNQIFEYESLVTRLGQLRKRDTELLGTYTERNPRVLATRSQIAALEADRSQMERRFPQLAARGATVGEPQDLMGEQARLAGIEAKVERLRTRFREARARAKQLSELGPQIAELERKKEVEEANYKYFQSTLDKTRIDEALDPSKIPNITAVQKPSAPRMVAGARIGVALKLAGGGLALGIALALAMDFLLNRTVKRRVELERRLHTPVLMSIPFTAANGRLRLGRNGKRRANGSETALAPTGSNGAMPAPWSPNHFIRPYCQAIRDRIGLFFELNNLTHKPKLVGVTSFTSDAGTSTIAAGLAAALSENDEGKVLLVNANLGPQDVHPFFQGKPAYSLAAALQSSSAIDPAAENLYLATAASNQAGPAQLGLKKFFDMMPNLKASDFDYIIFDMPPLEQTSPTWGMAPFMDKMLLVVEAEKVDRDVAERGYSRLLAGRDNISVLLNKARSYGPRWLQIEE
ncbi:hypothetical protein BH20VER1_BH20VER1_10990 [soil metagenome]